MVVRKEKRKEEELDDLRWPKPSGQSGEQALLRTHILEYILV